MNYYFHRTNSSGFVRMGLFGHATVLEACEKVSLEGTGRHVAVLMEYALLC